MLYRDHVFGLSSVRQSTCSIYSVCSGAPAGKDDYLIYSSAALGIVHDLKTNTQAFFDEHTDDISCISLCRQGNLVATGQVGKSPNLKVWSLKFGAKGGCETALVTSIGEGFFQRMVVEVAFSPDGTFVVAVSGDDHHMMGLWDVLTGLLCASAPTQNGVPPQIRALQWAPSKVSTDWINASAGTGLRDLLCTAGALSYNTYSSLNIKT